MRHLAAPGASSIDGAAHGPWAGSGQVGPGSGYQSPCASTHLRDRHGRGKGRHLRRPPPVRRGHAQRRPLRRGAGWQRVCWPHGLDAGRPRQGAGARGACADPRSGAGLGKVRDRPLRASPWVSPERRAAIRPCNTQEHRRRARLPRRVPRRPDDRPGCRRRRRASRGGRFPLRCPGNHAGPPGSRGSAGGRRGSGGAQPGAVAHAGAYPTCRNGRCSWSSVACCSPSPRRACAPRIRRRRPRPTTPAARGRRPSTKLGTRPEQSLPSRSLSPRARHGARAPWAPSNPTSSPRWPWPQLCPRRG